MARLYESEKRNSSIYPTAPFALWQALAWQTGRIGAKPVHCLRIQITMGVNGMDLRQQSKHELVAALQEEEVLALDPQIREQLLAMSAATIDARCSPLS